MVHLILLIILIIFVIWMALPFLKTQAGEKDKDTEDKMQNSHQINYKRPNTILLITTIIFFGLVAWVLPKFGVNFSRE